MGFEQFLLFLPAALALGIAPGANNLLAFASATQAGLRPAAFGLLGRAAAWTILITLVSLGLGVILSVSAAAFLVIKWLGVAYLVFLAIKFWIAPIDDKIIPPKTGVLMRREFLTLMGNPKAYLLLTAFLPQFVDLAMPLAPQLLILGSLYLIIECVAAMAWIGVGSYIGLHALTPRRRRLINRSASAFLAYAALMLARADRV